MKKNNDIVRFLESKDDKYRTWPRSVDETKDKGISQEMHAKLCGLLFQTNRRKKHETGALSPM